MAFVESIAAARIFLRKDDQPLQANQELVALGLANIGGSLFQSLPSGGGTSQTAVNDDAGAKSQLAGVVTAGVTALTLILLAPLVSLMPEATLGVLVIVAAFKLINLGEYRRLYSYRRAEFIWAVVSLLGVIFVGTLQGILVAIVVSLMAITYHADHPPVYVLGRKPGTDIFRPLEEYPEDEKFPGLLLLRSVGLLYFGSVPSAIKKIDDLVNQYQPKVVVLDCSAIPNIEYTALKQVEDYEENLQKGGVSLWLARLNPECLKLVVNSNLGKKLGKERMFYNLEQAVEYYKTLQPASNSA